MDEQRTQLATPVLDPEVAPTALDDGVAPTALDDGPDAPSVQPAAARATPEAPWHPARRTESSLATPWAAALGLGWPLAIMATIALEPAPVDPDAPVPLVIELASLGLFVALLATVVAAGIRHWGAAVTGLAVGLLALTFTIACPVSGHHAVGLWWFGQLGLVVTMLATSLAALGQRTRATT